MKAYIDRIEDGKMVLINEAEKREWVVDHKDKYEHLSSGDYVTIKLNNEQNIEDIIIDEAETIKRKNRSSKLMEKLQKKKRESKFK